MRLVYYKNEDYNEGLHYCQKRKFRGTVLERWVDYDAEDKYIHVSVNCRVLTFIGNRWFYRPEESNWFSYKNGRFYGKEPMATFDNMPVDVLDTVLKELGLGWMRDMPRELMIYACKKNIFKSIILHNIYNQETLVKAIGHRVYRLKQFSWRALRDYLISDHMPSVWDLQAFTKNLDHSMRRLSVISSNLQDQEAQELRQLIYDLVIMAANENSIVDLRWSEKRMQQEHLKQIERFTQREMGTKALTPYYPENIIKELSAPNISLLSNEKEVFVEGTKMHHCLYSCYNNVIKNHKYAAFHMTSPEDCTFGVIRRQEGCELDQIYLKYDRNVTSSTREVAEQFIREKQAYLAQILSQAESEQNVVGMGLGLNNEALPF